MYCKMTLSAPEWNCSWKLRIILSFQTPNPEGYEKTCGGTRVVPLRVPAGNTTSSVVTLSIITLCHTKTNGCVYKAFLLGESARWMESFQVRYSLLSAAPAGPNKHGKMVDDYTTSVTTNMNAFTFSHDFTFIPPHFAR